NPCTILDVIVKAMMIVTATVYPDHRLLALRANSEIRRRTTGRPGEFPALESIADRRAKEVENANQILALAETLSGRFPHHPAAGELPQGAKDDVDRHSWML